MIDLLAGEWLKLRTTRLLHGTVPAAVGLSSAAVAGQVLAADGASALESTNGVRHVLAVTGTGAIIVLVVGILISAGEYRHGTAADTFLTTPRRDQVVAAKLAIGAAAGQAIVRTPLDNLLSPLADAVLLAVYGTAIAVAGIRVTATRDT